MFLNGREITRGNSKYCKDCDKLRWSTEFSHITGICVYCTDKLDGKKICSQCNENKPWANYYKGTARCKDCLKIWYGKNRESRVKYCTKYNKQQRSIKV